MVRDTRYLASKIPLASTIPLEFALVVKLYNENTQYVHNEFTIHMKMHKIVEYFIFILAKL